MNIKIALMLFYESVGILYKQKLNKFSDLQATVYKTLDDILGLDINQQPQVLIIDRIMSAQMEQDDQGQTTLAEKAANRFGKEKVIILTEEATTYTEQLGQACFLVIPAPNRPQALEDLINLIRTTAKLKTPRSGRKNIGDYIRDTLVKIIFHEPAIANLFAEIINKMDGYKAVICNDPIPILEQYPVPDIIIMGAEAALTTIDGEGDGLQFIELVREGMPDTRIIIPTSSRTDKTDVLSDSGHGKRLVDMPQSLEEIENMVKQAIKPRIAPRE